MSKFVRLHHDELDADTEVLPESVEVWEEHGWTVVDDGSNEEDVPANLRQPEQPLQEPQKEGRVRKQSDPAESKE